MKYAWPKECDYATLLQRRRAGQQVPVKEAGVLSGLEEERESYLGDGDSEGSSVEL
jgi:hypothetical protein